MSCFLGVNWFIRVVYHEYFTNIVRVSRYIELDSVCAIPNSKPTIRINGEVGTVDGFSGLGFAGHSTTHNAGIQSSVRCKSRLDKVQIEA